MNSRMSLKFFSLDLNQQNWKYFWNKLLYPSSESHVVDESEAIRWAEIAEWEERHDEDPWEGVILVIWIMERIAGIWLSIAPRVE